MSEKERALTDQEYIDQYCGGDARKFRASIVEGRKETISWDDLTTSTRVLTDYTQAARQLIQRHLGYLPAPSVYMPHEVFIRALAEANERQNYSHDQFHKALLVHICNDDMCKNGLTDNLPPGRRDIEQSQDPFCEALLIHIRHIRNDDMRKNGLTDNLPLSRRDIERYHSYLPRYKKAAKDRVTAFFGQEQNLDYTLHAELQLRETFAQGQPPDAVELSAVDCRAFTIIAYLRLYHEQGQQAADASPLPASEGLENIL